MTLTAIVLAAGAGTRMRSPLPKVLHEIGGRSMVSHVVGAVEEAGADRVVVVVGYGREQVGPHVTGLVPGAVVAVQEEQLGTAHAVRVAVDAAGVADGTVLVAYGDTPLLEGESLRSLVADHEAADRAVTILSGVVEKPFGYGRIVRDAADGVVAIVEEKDATDEQRAITEINSGILALDGAFLAEALPQIGNANAKGEYYLTDIVGLAHAAGRPVGAYVLDDVLQTEGANDPEQLAVLEAAYQSRHA